MPKVDDACSTLIDVEETHEIPLRVFGNTDDMVGPSNSGAFGGRHAFRIGKFLSEQLMDHVVDRHDSSFGITHRLRREVGLVNDVSMHVRPSERSSEPIRKAHYLREQDEVVGHIPAVGTAASRIGFQIVVDVKRCDNLDL